MARKSKSKKRGFFTKGNSDFLILIIVLLLLAIGLIMVLSASSPSSLSERGNSYSYFRRQLLAAAMGLFFMYLLSKIDYHVYKKFVWIAYIAMVAVLVFVGLVRRRSRWS